MKFQISNFKKGFTLIELLVVIAIIIILSAITLFAISIYINKGKDANIKGNLVVLIPAGEAFYNMDNTYSGFCDETCGDPESDTCSSVVKSIFSQMPLNANPCCQVNADGDQWAACASFFSAADTAFCVDSRGIKEPITLLQCQGMASGSVFQCP